MDEVLNELIRLNDQVEVMYYLLWGIIIAIIVS